MRRTAKTLGSFFVLLGLTTALTLTSCASFKLVSQRPAAGAKVDATAGASDAAPAEPDAVASASS